MDKLVNTFHDDHSNIAKAQIKKKISEIAEKEKHADGYGSARWVVKADAVTSAGDLEVI